MRRKSIKKLPKKRICLINDSFPPVIDGVSNAVLNYAEILSKEKCRVTVAAPFYPETDDTKYPFKVIRYPSFDTSKKVGYRAGMPFSADALRALEKERFDLIHSHCPITSTMLARMLRDRIDAPIVMTYHTKFDIDIANAIRGKLLQEQALLLLVKNIQACDEIWTVSRGAGENLHKIGFTGNYRVMPNGVDLPKGRVAENEIINATGSYNLPDSVPVFLFVGRMMWYKGIRIILDALRICLDAGMNFRMVFIGGGTDKNSIIQYSDTLHLSERVLFIEPINDRDTLRAWYCRGNLFLFPSTFDTNGLVVREASACSLASVLISESCASEGIKDGINGFLIEENPESLSELLKEIVKYPNKMKEVGECAQKDLYLSWEDSVGNAYKTYGEVIENYRDGKYQHREQLSDELFRAAADALSFASDRKEEREQFRNSFHDNKDQLLLKIQEESERIQEKMDEIKSSFDIWY